MINFLHISRKLWSLHSFGLSSEFDTGLPVVVLAEVSRQLEYVSKPKTEILFHFQWYEDWRKKFPSFELPEWIHPSQLTEKYTSLKPQFDASKWKDKLRENFKSFDPSTSRGPIGLPFQYNLLYNVGASSADVDFPSSNQSATNFGFLIVNCELLLIFQTFHKSLTVA